MRVKAQFEAAPADSSAARGKFLDLRADPRLIERIEPARSFPPLRNFLAAVNDCDSFFFTASCNTAHAAPPPAGKTEFIAQVELAFASAALNRDAKHFQDVATQLTELLAREGGDALRLELSLQKGGHHSGARGFSMAMELHARGATPEQGRTTLRSGACPRAAGAAVHLARAAAEVRRRRIGGLVLED